MADLYPSSYAARSHSSYHRHPDSVSSLQQISNTVYPTQLITPHHSGSSNDSSDDCLDQSPTKFQDTRHQLSTLKPESKPQATFLTKLYALLERPENHHMIRWDPAGEHIIVERPEQLALHVLPSIYRQSRFASFSRQLNIYGFMRKVNLRNVDPAIDDPDASTWSHPTLNRHSSPDVVANFKRRVPPRLPKPKPKKRDDPEPVNIPPPRPPTTGLGSVPLTSSTLGPPHKTGSVVRQPRNFTLPSFTPLGYGGLTGWGGASYPRSVLPPLTVPPNPPHLSQNNVYGHSHALHPVDSISAGVFSYTNNGRDMMVPSSHSHYTYPETNSWPFSSNGNSSSSSTNGSLSSLLNPTNNGYSSRSVPSITASYASPFSHMPANDNNASSMSPDSRPNTGYSHVSSMAYEDNLADYSRPSSDNRPVSPGRPHSSKNGYPSAGTLGVRRHRRHSQALSPYPSPYDSTAEIQRPSISPHSNVDSALNGIPRVRSMIQLPSVDSYSLNPSQPEFAYSATATANVTGSSTSVDSMDGVNGWGQSRPIRPSTSASSVSAASRTSSSQATTPPLQEGFNDGGQDINRFLNNQSHPISALYP